ncbi:MAG TPA: exodeoxyribonuclease VII large subunit [Candidatus Fimivicinus intestinavium]|nr:exodeoxyribonuclease VII large subunit [Candidatus Fimivicinus intestinavium]
MKTPLVLTVGQLNTYVKSLLDGDRNLAQVFLCGEISNFTNHYRSGHFYFSLKDETAVIRAVMFRSSAQRIKFLPRDGMRVIVRGHVSLYERDGQYQLYVDDMQPDGTGALHLAFEQLKEKLEKEGVFSSQRKRPLPRYPMRIGVVTSPTGAAVRDIINVLSRRFPLAQVILQPVQVQGEEAPGQIVQAIQLFNAKKAADVLIVGRGGGSLEELWAFNNESVARAVAASQIPVVSAVGHETDFTICDFAADLRAPTPSAAAELCVPDAQEELRRIALLLHSAARLMLRRLEAEQQRLDLLAARAGLREPARLFNSRRQSLEGLRHRLLRAMPALLLTQRNRLAPLAGKLDAMSPLRVLSRGYTVAQRAGRLVCSAKELQAGDRLQLTWMDGGAACEVLETQLENSLLHKGEV